MNRFIITEEEKKHIKSLYEQDQVDKFLKSIDQDNDGDYNDWDGTDEETFFNTIMNLKTLSDYYKLNNKVKEKTNKNISDFIDSELDTAFPSDGEKETKMYCHVLKLGLKISKHTKEDCDYFLNKNKNTDTEYYQTPTGSWGNEFM